MRLRKRSATVRWLTTMTAVWLTLTICVLPSVGQQATSRPKVEPSRNIVRSEQAAQRFDAGRKWAVLIGVEEYLDPAINKLEYCVDDVRLMERVLVEKCGYEAQRVLVIADDQTKEHLKPLRINLDIQTRQWLKQVQPTDTVLVLFSGHGFLDEQGQGFLAPKDTQRDNLGLSGFRTDALRDMLRQCKAAQKILILDCCHAGADKGDDKPGASSEELGASFAKAEGLITLASCKKSEKSHEWQEKKQGLFTYFVAAGLSGRADRDGDGIVDSDELYRYATDNVPVTAQRDLNKPPQTPIRLIGEDVVGVFGLARVARRAAAVTTDRQVAVEFEVRAQDASGKPANRLPDAQVELLYRVEEKSRPQRLAVGTTDRAGSLKLNVTTTAAQQLRGEFLAIVSHGDQQRVWQLDNFPAIRRWELSVPADRSEFTNSVGMRLKLIPASEFLMGSSDADIGAYAAVDSTFKAEYAEHEKTRHRVRISEPFYLGIHEVTRGQFAKFVDDRGYKTEAETDGQGGYGYNAATGKFEGRDVKYNWRNTGFSQTDMHPVVNVTWNDAQKFCEWLTGKEGQTYRLPTEAEWEYACRAGTTTAFHSGNDPELLVKVANIADGTAKEKFSDWTTISGRDGHVFSAPVGSFAANGFGLFDMHGNVFEWCQDVYDAKAYSNRAGVAADPLVTSGSEYRVLRGGSWLNNAWYSRSAYRLRYTPDFRVSNNGLRVMCLAR